MSVILQRPRFLVVAMALVTVLGVRPSPLSAQEDAPSDASLFATRRAVWHSFFANDPDLARVLPADFVAVEDGDSLWRGREATLAEAAASAAEGTRLVDLRFPANVVQRYGRTVIVHSRYVAVLRQPSGRVTLRGRITEVFVWDGARWIHPSWNMRIESREPGGDR